MTSFRQSRSDRAKAAAAALAVHVVIGAAFLTGLATDLDRRDADALKTFDVNEPPPPPIQEPPPSESEAAEGDPGAAGKKAEPTPIVAPEPRIELPAPSPVTAAPVAGQGAAPRAGAAAEGTGIGAGGIGTGRGGGGAGGSGAGRASGAVLIRGGVRDSDNRGGRYVGWVAVRLEITPQGRVSNCSLVESSGRSDMDSATCRIALRRMIFRPARDLQGRAIADVTFYRVHWHR